VFVGVSETARAADVGVGVANRDCFAAYAGSRVCISTEVAMTVDPPLPATRARMLWDPVYDDRGAVDRHTQATTGCYGLTRDNFVGGVAVDENGRLESYSCDVELPFACCAPPE